MANKVNPLILSHPVRGLKEASINNNNTHLISKGFAPPCCVLAVVVVLLALRDGAAVRDFFLERPLSLRLRIASAFRE